MPHRTARVVVINDSSIAKGGATKLALQLASGLSEQGVSVTFFAGDAGINPAFENSQIDVVSLGGAKLIESRGRSIIDGLYNRKAKNALSRMIDEIDTPNTIYHLHGWSQILSPSIFDALADVAHRTVLTAHDFFLACPNGNFSIYPKSRQCDFTPLSLQCLAANCDKRNYVHKLWRVGRQAILNATSNLNDAGYTVLAIQAGMAPFLARGGVPEDKIRVMSNPAAQLRMARTPAEHNKTILYVGRIEHEKGVDVLAAASRDIGAHLCIIGEGEAEAAVRRTNPDAEFPGWLGPDEIAARLGEARFLVMPSRCTEPFGLAGAEALRAGVPVLVSNSCLIGADVERAGMGARLDVFDKAAFTSTLSEWMRNDALVARMSVAAFDNANTIAQTDDAWLDAHLSLYDQLLAGNEKSER